MLIGGPDDGVITPWQSRWGAILISEVLSDLGYTWSCTAIIMMILASSIWRIIFGNLAVSLCSR